MEVTTEQSAGNKEVLTGVFQQKNVAPRVEKVSSEQVLKQAREASLSREESRNKRDQLETEKLEKIEKEVTKKSIGKEKATPADAKVNHKDSDSDNKKDADKSSEKKSKDKKSKDKDKNEDKQKDKETPSR